MEIIVDVTEMDILEGVPMECDQCPIAIALLRHGEEVSVAVKNATLIKDGEMYTAGLPSQVTKFICDFDDGLPVSPFQFPLNLET